MIVSAIICTHNPRGDHFRRTLEALREQSLSKTNWELLVVDNGSAEPLAGRLDLSWHPNARVIREDELGVANARVRGILESKGELIVFIDDDNVLDSAYFTACLEIAAKWPLLGVWGPSILPEFEIEPPAHLRPYLHMLALREITRPRWSNVRTCRDAEPWGAGLCVRRSAAVVYRDHFLTTKLRMLSRTGALLLSGEDTEICFVTCGLGLGMGLFPQLQLIHLIPKRKLNDDYIIRISSGLHATHLLLSYKWAGIMPGSPFSLVEILRCGKKMLVPNRFQQRMAWAYYSALLTARKVIGNSNAQ